MTDRPRPGPYDLACVFVGGAVGTAVRWAAEQAWPARDGQWPAGTFAVNMIGAFVLGALLEALIRIGADEGRRRRIRLGVGTGLCGALTTYSAFAAEITILGKDGHVGIAVMYALVSVVVGVLAVFAGIRAAQRVVPVGGGA